MSNEAHSQAIDVVEELRELWIRGDSSCWSSQAIETLLRAIDERNAQLQLYREALRWCLDTGAFITNGQARGVPFVEPPAHLRAVLAEVAGEK